MLHGQSNRLNTGQEQSNRPSIAREQNIKLDDLMPLIREQLAQGKTVCFAPRGTSMLPMLRQGIDQVILAAPPQKLKKYDLPLYQRENGQYVLHRIVRTDDGTGTNAATTVRPNADGSRCASLAGHTYTCMGDSQFWPEPGIGQGQVIAVVTAFYRGAKRIEVTATAYQIYCRLWHYSRWPRRILRSACYRLRSIGSKISGLRKLLEKKTK